MSDRLQELLQQRALLQSHLAWVDREIAAASGPMSSAPAHASDSTASNAPASTGLIVPPQSSGSSASRAPDADAEEILAQYRLDSTSVQTDVRKGCLLYFFGAFLLLGLVITAFYFLRTRPQALESETRAIPSATPAER
jgi:hypothetical protein